MRNGLTPSQALLDNDIKLGIAKSKNVSSHIFDNILDSIHWKCFLSQIKGIMFQRNKNFEKFSH